MYTNQQFRPMLARQDRIARDIVAAFELGVSFGDACAYARMNNADADDELLQHAERRADYLIEQARA